MPNPHGDCSKPSTFARTKKSTFARIPTPAKKVFAICWKKGYHYFVRMKTAIQNAEYFYFWYYFAQTGGGTSA